MKRTIKITLMIAIAIAAGVGVVYAASQSDGDYTVNAYGGEPGDLTVEGDACVNGSIVILEDQLMAGNLNVFGYTNVVGALTTLSSLTAASASISGSVTAGSATVSGGLAADGSVSAGSSILAGASWSYFGNNSSSAYLGFGTPPSTGDGQQVNRLVALDSHEDYGYHTYLGLDSRTVALRAVHHQDGPTCAMVEVNPSDTGDVVITLGTSE